MFHSRDIAHDQVSCLVQRGSSNSKILDTNPTLRMLDVLAAEKKPLSSFCPGTLRILDVLGLKENLGVPFFPEL